MEEITVVNEEEDDIYRVSADMADKLRALKDRMSDKVVRVTKADGPAIDAILDRYRKVRRH